jgi:hypothetical protein
LWWRAVDQRLPPPPRWWRAAKRCAAKTVRPCVGLGGCGGGGATVAYGEGLAGDEAREVVAALGLTDDDQHALWEAFMVTGRRDGGEGGAPSCLARVKYRTTISPFSLAHSRGDRLPLLTRGCALQQSHHTRMRTGTTAGSSPPTSSSRGWGSP